MRCPPERTVPEELFLARTHFSNPASPVVSLSINSCKQKISCQYQPGRLIRTVRPQPQRAEFSSRKAVLPRWWFSCNIRPRQYCIDWARLDIQADR